MDRLKISMDVLCLISERGRGPQLRGLSRTGASVSSQKEILASLSLRLCDLKKSNALS